VIVSLAAGLGQARDAAASQVHVMSRTVGEGYRVRAPGPEGQLLSRRRLVQYVNLGVYDLLPPREADQTRRAVEDGQLRIVSSMRLRHDFGNFTRHASGQAADLTEALDGRQIDLLFGYLEGSNLGGWVDVRAGRQFEMSGLDWYVFDGAWTRLRTPGHVAFEVFGGFEVDGTQVFGFPTHELDGTWDTPADEAYTPMVGGAFALDQIAWMDARFAYRRSFSPQSVNRDLTGPDGTGSFETAVDQEVVSASLALRFLRGALSPFAAARYNVGTDRIDDVSGGLSWTITDLHRLRALYLRTIPSFDLDSIFNVFSITPVEDVRVVYEVRPGVRWTLHARSQTRIFRETTTAELGSEPSRPTHVGYGGGVGAVHRRRRFGLRLDGFGLGGQGGVRAGGSVDTRTHVWWDRLALDGRFYGVYFRDELVEDRRGYSLAFQAGGNLRLWDGVYFNLLAEELLTRFYDQAFRILGILSIDWRFRAGQR
jgi:hypothetical protein